MKINFKICKLVLLLLILLVLIFSLTIEKYDNSDTFNIDTVLIDEIFSRFNNMIGREFAKIKKLINSNQLTITDTDDEAEVVKKINELIDPFDTDITTPQQFIDDLKGLIYNYHYASGEGGQTEAQKYILDMMVVLKEKNNGKTALGILHDFLSLQWFERFIKDADYTNLGVEDSGEAFQEQIVTNLKKLLNHMQNDDNLKINVPIDLPDVQEAADIRKLFENFENPKEYLSVTHGLKDDPTLGDDLFGTTSLKDMEPSSVMSSLLDVLYNLVRFYGIYPPAIEQKLSEFSQRNFNINNEEISGADLIKRIYNILIMNPVKVYILQQRDVNVNTDEKYGDWGEESYNRLTSHLNMTYIETQ